MGNALLRFLCGRRDAADAEPPQPQPPPQPPGPNSAVAALAHDLFNFQNTSQVPKELSKHVQSSKKDQANWYREILVAWKKAKRPPKTAEEATQLVIETLKRIQKTDVEGFLDFYGLPLSGTLVELSTEAPTTLPEGVKFEFQTLPVDAKAVQDGDSVTVYVSASDPRESLSVPQQVYLDAVERLKACSNNNYGKAKALHQKIISAGYRILKIEDKEILARKYRIRLRGIDAPEHKMPYGDEAKKELTNLVQGKCLRILVYGEDHYGRSVGDIYCNGIFVQEVLLKKGFAWHYVAYDKRPQFARWEREARAKRVGLWASPNPEKPWEWRKNNPRDD